MSSEPTKIDASLPSILATSWADHIEGINAIGESILSSGWTPTAILAITRGGLIPAAILAYILDVRRIHTVRIQHYDNKNSRLESGPQFVEETRPFDALNIYTERLLIVDDIIDTGETLKLVRRAAHDHAEEIKVAALCVRSDQKHSVDWYWKIEDEWVVFPWAPEN